MTKWLYILVASAALLNARPAASDSGSDAPEVPAAQPVSAEPQPQPQALVKTYKVSKQRQVHAKGFRKHASRRARSFKKASDLATFGMVPGNFDLRPTLTQIENQANCGSCWAFSLTATNRDGHALNGNDPGRLSQEWLIDNSTQADGCSGGDFDAADALLSPGGSPLWEACPYALGAGKCSAYLPPAAGITGWHMLGDNASGPSVQDIESYIAASGKPVSIAVAAGAGDWESYAGGIYNGCTAGELDHMINIVGWDNEGASFNRKGNLPAGKGVWILRNSWGTSWGEAGYMRTKITDRSGKRCNNVAEQAAFFTF
jgi:hypothetical protein